MSKVKISIDHNKCFTPKECRVCLGACPPGVFNLIFTDKDFHAPKHWIIEIVFPKLCIKNLRNQECNICIDKCPEKAISIK